MHSPCSLVSAVVSAVRPSLALAALATAAIAATGMSANFAAAADAPSRPNIVIILADDLGFSDVGCYGSEIATPNIDRLAAGGVRFTQFYNAARCCPTRAALLTGLYPHQTGVGHMLGDWNLPGYDGGLNERCATVAELLQAAGYRTYHVGKWHVGGVGGKDQRNHPLNRGFDNARGNAGGGGFFRPQGVYFERESVKWNPENYITDVFSDWAVDLIEQHGREHADQPFFLHLCYTSPHFPLQAKPDDIARHRGHYREGWDSLRQARFARQQTLGLFESANCRLSPRDPIAQAWDEVAEADRDEWDLRMAVHAAMVDCMDQGIGRVLNAVSRIGATENTLVVFLSDNGASAEFLDTWPNPARGHKPGSVTGTMESHRCLEIGWANAANTPFRENKMWVHEGGISTPCIVSWPKGIAARNALLPNVGHIIDLMPTCLELAGAQYPQSFNGRDLLPPEGRSLVPVLTGRAAKDDHAPRTLAWEHEGNRAIRDGDLKLVASFRGPWELYDLSTDRSETRNLAADRPDDVARLSAAWQKWADRVGVVEWSTLPGGNYKPSSVYRRKSEPVEP